MVSILFAAVAVVCAAVLGFLLGVHSGLREIKEQRRQEEIERRLKGPSKPRHRATSEPAVIRVARVARSNVWRT